MARIEPGSASSQREHFTDCSTETNYTSTAKREHFFSRFELKGDSTRNNNVLVWTALQNFQLSIITSCAIIYFKDCTWFCSTSKISVSSFLTNSTRTWFCFFVFNKQYTYCECLTSWPVFLRSETQRGRVGGAIIIFCACVLRVKHVLPYCAARWTYRGGPMTAKRHARESSGQEVGHRQ